jgi:hypothetical protein
MMDKSISGKQEGSLTIMDKAARSNGYAVELVQADRFTLCMDSAQIEHDDRPGCA